MIRLSPTLRDARRWLALPRRSQWSPVRYGLASAGIPLSGSESQIDRLIARYGARFPLEDIPRAERERKEDVESNAHITPSASGGAAGGQDSGNAAPTTVHRAGSDGGERPEPSGKGTRSDPADEASRGNSSTAADPERADDPAAMRDGDASREGDGLDITANDGAHEGSDECAHAGELGTHDESPSGDSHANSADSASSDAECADDSATHGSSPSRHSRWSSGGVTTDLSIRGRDSKLARKIARELKRLLRVDRGQGDDSPRIDSRRLVTEMASRRCSLSRARRSEVARELCVIAVDVSGSCSSFSEELWAAATSIAAATEGDVVEPYEAPNISAECHVLVIAHSNGWLLSDTGPESVGISDYIRHLGRALATTIVLGDCDGSIHYRALCESGQRMVWLNNYAASHGAAPASSGLRAHTRDWSRQPIHMQGCGSAESVLAALRKI